MQISGEELINAPRDVVWTALNDPEILRQAIPGCQSVEKDGDTAFTATVKVKVGPVSANFKGNVSLSNIDAPNGYTITGEGKGGAAGFGKGAADVQLKETDSGTLLSYNAEASVGGKMAQIGSRLIDSTAKKLASEFFAKFNELVSSNNAAAAEAQSAETAAPEAAKSPEPDAGTPIAPTESPMTGDTPPEAETSSSTDLMRPAILIPLGIVAALILYYLAAR
ncbi:MAG: carbon monoxide dehydrogenase [Alphaproteobacteria bacterium]|nr:MAG: carbon monoxide dehydrogenase [Alphaproteobacteria bacterium]